MSTDESDVREIQRHVGVSYVALIFMNFIDWLYTDLAMWVGGEEINSLVLHIFNHYGSAGIAAFKAAWIIILGCLLPVLFHRRRIRLFFYFSVIVYVSLTVYHVMWYFSL